MSSIRNRDAGRACFLVTVNLLELTEENAAVLIDGAVIEAGSYEWLAMDVDAEFDNVFAMAVRRCLSISKPAPGVGQYNHYPASAGFFLVCVV